MSSGDSLFLPPLADATVISGALSLNDSDNRRRAHTAWFAGAVVNARIEHDKALARVMTAVLKDDTELFKQFMDNESFRRWLTDTVFGLTYGHPETGNSLVKNTDAPMQPQ